MDAAREDMAMVKVTEKDADGRIKWRQNINCGSGDL